MATRRSFLAMLGMGLFSASAAWADPPRVVSAPVPASDAVDIVRQYLTFHATNEWTQAYALLSRTTQKMFSVEQFAQITPNPVGSSADNTPPIFIAVAPLFANTRGMVGYTYQVVGIAPEDPHTVLVSAQPQSTEQTGPTKPLLLRIVTAPDPQTGASRIEMEPSLLRTAPIEFAKARENARQAASLSNLRQISLAMIMYAQDHNEHFPPAANWVDAVTPYLTVDLHTHTVNLHTQEERQRIISSLFHDPSAPDSQKWSYAFNSNLSGLSLAHVDKPATTVLLFESSAGVKNASDTGESIPHPGRHSGGTDYALADGHCKWYHDALSEADRRQYLSFSPTDN